MEVPLAFYFSPLQNAIFEVRNCLLSMYDAGPLYCKYIIEENLDLHNKVIEMVKWDNIV
jgi:hypothetical protein